MHCTAVALALIGLAAFVSAAPADIDQFASFISSNGQTIKDEKDADIRYMEYEKDKKAIESHNADPNCSYKEGLNENSDLTEKELERDRLGVLTTPAASARDWVYSVYTRIITRIYDPYGTTPSPYFTTPSPYFTTKKDDGVTSPNNGGSSSCVLSTKGYNNGKYFGAGVVIDWGDKMTPVKDQGKCGSCWAFAAICVLEARLVIKKGLARTTDLSEQQLVDCSKTYGNMGCRGGVPSWAFNYVKTTGKVASEASYPYAQAEQSMCLAPSTGLMDVLFSSTTSQNIVSVPSGNEAALLEGLKTGPVCVCIGVNANKGFFQYKSGIFECTTKVESNMIDHAIVLVGYTSNTFIVRNSWGCSWGVGGYGEVARAGDRCGITLQAQYPLL